MRYLTALPFVLAVAGSGCAAHGDPIHLFDAEPDYPHFLGPLDGLSVRLTNPVEESADAVPLSDLTLTFSEPYDPTTVGPETIWLVERESLRRIPVEFDTTDAVRVVLDPVRPIATGARYHVMVDGVKSAAGEVVPTYDGRFFTRLHLSSSFIQFGESGVFKWYDGEFHENEDVWSATYVYAGDDGVMHTSDDSENMQSNWAFDDLRDNVWVRVIDSTGADGVYRTADDEHRYQRELEWDGVGLRSSRRINSGPDHQLGTDDDEMGNGETLYYDDRDRLEYSCRVAPEGAISDCVRYFYGSGSEARVTLSGPGPDGVWRTDDDLRAEGWTAITRDIRGVVIRSDEYRLNASGETVADAEFRTAYAIFEHTQEGLVRERRSYEGAGPDGVWETLDDAATTRVVFNYDEDGLTLSRDTYLAGSDQRFDTVSDTLDRRFEW